MVIFFAVVGVLSLVVLAFLAGWWLVDYYATFQAMRTSINLLERDFRHTREKHANRMEAHSARLQLIEEQLKAKGA